MVHVHQGAHPESISFFLTIGEGTSHTRDEKLKQVRNQIEARLQESKTFLSGIVYSGRGICPIFLEAAVPVSHYYDIGSLTKTFLDTYGPDGLHSQSYLFVNHEPLVRGYDIIDDRTLLEHRSKENVVHRYCPAAYDELSVAADEVIEFLTANKKTLMSLARGEVDDPIASLVFNVAASALRRDLHLASTHILSYCTRLEGDLRARLDPFLTSVNTDRSAAMKTAGIAPGKHLALGDLFKIYDQTAGAEVQAQLAGLVQTRNKTAHHADNADDWRSAADTIIRSRDKLKLLYQKITTRAAAE